MDHSPLSPPTLPFLLKRKTLSRNFTINFLLNLIGSFDILRPFIAIGLTNHFWSLGLGVLIPNQIEIYYQERRERMALWEATNSGDRSK